MKKALYILGIVGSVLVGWTAVRLSAQEPAVPAVTPVYLWLEPEWFEGVQGNFAYWPGPDSANKATGSWGVAGPGISAEWSQGGESEWNSMGAGTLETNASCRRSITIPRAGNYRVWVRYVEHRDKATPFTVRVEQNGKNAVETELGAKPVLPRNDEYLLYWGFSFAWNVAEGNLAAGPATLTLNINRAGEAWRQVDAVLITDDLNYTPVAREKPIFAYAGSMELTGGTSLPRSDYRVGASWRRPPLAGMDFAMWTGLGTDAKWWEEKGAGASLYDAFFQFSPPKDIQDKFHQQFAGQKNLPIISWPGLRPGFYLGEMPDLSPGKPLRAWLERTKAPFYIMTNYAAREYDAATGPANYEALRGAFKDQFLGYIHGEAFGTVGVNPLSTPKAATRRAQVEAWAQALKKQQTERWSAIYKTPVDEEWLKKSISCLSVESVVTAHLYQHLGARVVGFEMDATNANAPLRIAFERGAARQFGGNFINYASGNFGDNCNYFTQQPVVPRGAPAWFHSKYTITDGVPIDWYRKYYYLNYLSGASAIYWEQSLGNQWMLPGPGTHPVQLSPFGRATTDFQSFVSRLPERGEPYTPVAFLLSYGHGYEPVNYDCKMLHHFTENAWDRELRELFSVAYYPATQHEALPITPDRQSLSSGTYGNIFDILVDRPERMSAINDYRVVWAAGDVELGGTQGTVLANYVQNGGVLVANVQSAAGKLPPALSGVAVGKDRRTFSSWKIPGGASRPTVPYEVVVSNLDGASAVALADDNTPLITRRQVGKGWVYLVLVPHNMSLDERAHPALPYLMNHLTANLLPVQIRLPDGRRPAGEIMYQINRTSTGWLVMLMNNRGVDKTPNGIARVDRREWSDIVVQVPDNARTVREYTSPRDLPLTKMASGNAVRLRVPAGDLQVIGIIAG